MTTPDGRSPARDTWRLTAPRLPGEAPEATEALLWSRGALGVWQHGEEVVAWFDDEPEPLPGRATTVRREPGRDWQAAWKRTIAPITAGRFRLVPSWLAEASTGTVPGPGAPASSAPTLDTAARVDLVLDPGHAFGSGHHPTTTLCLELLGETDLAGRSVADVGTGTGVLAIAAALAGARLAVGVDVDADAIDAARANARANGVDVPLEVGSTRALLGRPPFDLVVANLLTDTVTELAADLAGLVVPGGDLVVSGITGARSAGPARALRRVGLTLREQRGRDGWVAMRWRR